MSTTRRHYDERELAAHQHELRLKSILYLTTPAKWPHDRLPLKRPIYPDPKRPRYMDLQYAIILPDDLLAVYVDANLYHDDPRTAGKLTRYASPQAILDDGWMID